MADEQLTTLSEYFLDTNIILANLFKYEPKYKPCKKLLKSINNKYTCEVVHQEVETILQRRKGYYLKLINYRIKPNRPALEDYIMTVTTLESDQRFLKAFIEFLQREYRGQDWYQMFRTHLALVEMKKELCFQQEIKSPLIPRANNPILNGQINNIIQNLDDSQIFINMLIYFQSHTQYLPLQFTTNDQLDFLNNKEKIYLWYRKQYQDDPFFEIVNIREALNHL